MWHARQLMVAAAALLSTSVCQAGVISNIGTNHSPFVGAPGPGSNGKQAYDTSLNLAYVGNGFAKAAVAKDVIPGYPTIHRPEFLNDGFYGNGTSWITNSALSWAKIDLGRSVDITSITFGRDRRGILSDRHLSRLIVEVAATDNVYANGDDSNDSVEYTQIFDSANSGGVPWFGTSHTLQLAFNSPVQATFVKLTVGGHGADIDEFEIFGNAAGNIASVPEPSTLAAFGVGLFAVGFHRRRSKPESV